MLKPPKIRIFGEDYPASVWLASILAVAIIYILAVLVLTAYGPTPIQ